jgi:hypothetical protein
MWIEVYTATALDGTPLCESRTSIDFRRKIDLY